MCLQYIIVCVFMVCLCVCIQTLLGQANNRKSKKDRKKEIRQMEDRYQELEQKLNDLKRNSRGNTGGTRFYTEPPGE